MSFVLEDYIYDMRRCMRCSSCKWIDHIYMPNNRFVYRCPSYGKYYFSQVAYGRMKVGLALVEGRLNKTPKLVDTVFQCTMCGACDAGCKRNLDLEILNTLEALRGWMVEKGWYPRAFDRVVNSIGKDHNRFGFPHKDRKKWQNGIPLNKEAETIYFVGCASSYINKEIAQSTVKILNAIGIEFNTFQEEKCCGHPLFAMGHFDAFKKQLDHNLTMMKRIGAKRLVISCAECYKTWKVDYPRWLRINTEDLGFEVVHITELIAPLVANGTLKFSKPFDLKTTWHDPCNLGRLSEPWIHWEGTRGKWACLVPKEGFPPKEFRRGVNGIYDQPREILSSIPGLELLEMPRHHEFSWCCGGHGGAQEAYPDLVAYSADERLEEAKAIGAEVIVSACPYCKQTFLSEVKRQGYHFKIYDITEIIAQVISK